MALKIEKCYIIGVRIEGFFLITRTSLTPHFWFLNK